MKLALLLLALVPTEVPEKTFAEHYTELYDRTCEISALLYDEVDCSEIPEPVLIITSLVDEIGAWGVYIKDEPYLFVSPKAPDVGVIIMHEMAHYILWEAEAERGRCASEAAARLISGQTGEWREQYKCTDDANISKFQGLETSGIKQADAG